VYGDRQAAMMLEVEPHEHEHDFDPHKRRQLGDLELTKTIIFKKLFQYFGSTSCKSNELKK
jgi:hypothetical protein